MQFSTKALVLRVNETGTDDHFLTLLTAEKGIISAFFRKQGKKRAKMGSTEALCYTNFVLFQGRERYIVDSAEPIELFFPLRQDIERLALAQYFCQLLQVLAPSEEGAGEFLRLILNTLHFLGMKERSPIQMKALFELRCLSLAGFMPDLVGCARCGSFENGQMFFSPSGGSLLCASCLQNTQSVGYTALSSSALAAMRHIIYADLSRLFSFTITGESLKQLSRYAEQYVLHQTDRSYPALDFYRSLDPTV